MFEQLINNPFLYSLSLTLLHFLWQGLLVALILKSLLSIVANNKSKLRYMLATLAMLTNVILAILTFAMVYPDTSSGANSNLSPIPLTSLVNELTQQNPLFSYQELLPSILAYSLPYLSLLWLASIAFLAGKLLIEVRNVNILPVRSSVEPSPELLLRFNQLVKQIQLTKTPKLLISLKAEVPMAIGWLKPVVLLPIAMVTNLNSVQLEMLILHELAHIRRHDYLVNFLQTLVELLFFFHPCVHWVGKQMRNEREYCSDDIAVQHCGDAIAYAHTLTDTASLCSKKHCQTIPQMAMAASGGDLKARIIRLVDHHCAPTNYSSKWFAASSLLIALSLLSINQLLTMPFSQQVNNQFPWQKLGSSTKPDISDISKITTVSGGLNTVPQIDSIARGSIAKQLVSDSLVSSSNSTEITQMNDSMSDSTFDVIPSDEEKLSLNNNQIALGSSPKETIVNKNENIIDDVVLIKLDTPNKPVDSQNSLKPQVNQLLVKQKPEQQALSLEKMQDRKTYPQPTIEVAETVSAITSSLPTQLISNTLENNKPLPVKSAPVNVSYEAENKSINTSLTANQTHKESPYKQLSYIDEIKKLSSESMSYRASSNTIETMTPSLSIDDIAPIKREVIESFNSFEAKLLNSVSPIYPNLAKRRGIEMEVKVDFVIDRDGRVKDLKFDQQSKLIYFKSAIRSAMRKWRFSPATKNNNKVESSMTKIFSFSLHT
jgi:TonB family protein